MPSVASEVHNTLSSRSHPGHRSPASADQHQPAGPFAELLDSTTADSPARSARPVRSDRADRSEADRPVRSKDPQTADTSGKTPDNQTTDVSASAANPTKAKDAGDKAGPDDANTVEDAKAAIEALTVQALGNAPAPTATEDTKPADDKTVDTEDSSAKPAKADGDDPTQPDANLSAALDAAIVAPTPPVTPPPQTVAVAIQPLAATDAPRAETPATDAPPSDEPKPEIAALAEIAAAQATGQPARTKPALAKAPSHTGIPEAPKAGDPPAKAAANADPKGLPQIELDGNDQPRAKGEAVPAETRHSFASLLAKPDPDAATPAHGDATSIVKAGADTVQSLGAVAPSTPSGAPTATAATAAPTAPSQAQMAPVPFAGLAVEITTQASAGSKHFEIRLDPPELGRIEVKLHVDNDGRVTSHLVADRADTLDLLKRDASQLERALQQAGLKTSDNALEFSLRQQAFNRDDAPGQQAAHLIVPDDDAAPLEALRQGYGRLLGLGGGLDIRV